MKSGITVIGEPIQTELDGKRFYRIDFSDGAFRYLRSVTTINKGARLPSFLDKWQMDQVAALGVQGFWDAMNAKAHDGEVVHKFAENKINGEEINRLSLATIDDKQFGFDNDTWPLFESFLAWYAKRNPEFLWTEKTLYSLAYGFAGRSDGLCIIDGKRTVIDFKSSKSVQEDHKLQGCAYLVAASEMGENVDQVLILCLGAENKQGFSECYIDNPYEIHNYFMGFYHKSRLVSWANPTHV
jgi:hypothetical protein